MAKFLEGWVEEEVLSILQTPLSLPISPPPPSKLLNKKKIFYVLNIYSDQKILLVTDSKIRITILLPQLHEEHQEIFNNLTKNSFIILEDYYYATFLQSNQTEHHFSSLEHLGVGFPILMICSSFTTTKSGKIRRSKSPWTEINETPAIKKTLSTMTFFELIESFQKQKSFRQRVSPQYDSSYLLATHHCVIPDDQLRNLQTGHESRVQPPPITIDINFPSLPLPAVEKGTTRGRKRAQRSVAQSAPSTPTKSGSHKSTPSSLLSMSCFQDHLTESCIDELKKWFSRRSHGDATVSGQQMKNWQSPQRNKRAQESQEAQEIVDISVQDPVKHKRRRKEGTSIKPVKDDAVHVDVEEIDESPKQHQLPDDKEKQNKKIATTKRSTRSTKKVILMNVSDDEPTSSHKEEQVINPKEQSGDRLEILAKNNLSSSAQFALRFYLEI